MKSPKIKIMIIVLVALMVVTLISAELMASGYRYYTTNRYRYITRNYRTPYYRYYTTRTNQTPVQEKPEATPTQTQEEPVVEPEPAPTVPEQSNMNQMEQQMLNMINQERAANGVQPLKMDSRLVTLARKKSQDMIDNNYFSHTSPTYGSPFQMLKDAGVSYRTAGENIAGNSSVSGAHKALMNSSGHRRNILNPNYTAVGIGIVKGGPYGMMFTQLFIG